MSDRNEEVKKLAQEAMQDEKKLAELGETLSVGSRRDRQQAASALSLVAKSEPTLLVPFIDNLIDALNRPEAQTRWECLEALAILVDYDARSCNKAIPEAETSLFDEESGPVRLAAMRFLCKLGATTENRSEKVWPLVDEGIQCYHGDLEFGDMLLALVEFSNGKLSDSVKQEFSARMAFDAANGKGTLKRRAQQIIDNLA
ncbi:MAG: hypothetical protein IKF56_06565 [Eggerthellaceae bacterium]|nr:hypothetical protein [Eggerthellaceae bacterium]